MFVYEPGKACCMNKYANLLRFAQSNNVTQHYFKYAFTLNTILKIN